MTPTTRHLLRTPALACGTVAALLILRAPAVVLHGQPAAPRQPVYDQIKAFQLGGGSADVTGLVLKRDRVEMTFTGTFYFASPVEGRVTGAVFVGAGTMKAEVPPVEFERDNVKRLLGADVVDSDFKTAVLRMTDDTFDRIGATAPPREPVPGPPAAQKLATEFEPRLLQETGLNLSARLAASIVNAEAPGVFFAQFDGGRRGRFSYALDQQTRIPVSKFGINSGEKGLIFAYQQPIYSNETWLAFYLESEYASRRSAYSDANDLVDITRYQIDADLRDAAKRLGIAARIDMLAKTNNVRAVSFNLGEGLGAYQETGLKNQFHVTSAAVGGQRIPMVQEPWESGFTIFLPAPLAAGEKLSLDVAYEGDFMVSHPRIPECYYLLSNDIWLPRHGYLDRATFDLTYRTAKRHKVASNGTRISEQPDDANKDLTVTRYKLDQPVSLVAFAIGPFARTTETLTFEQGGTIPLEFNSTQKNIQAINEKFILDELSNSVRYFAAMFGKYPYSTFGAVFHPRDYGQGFATMLFIPNADTPGMVSGALPLYQFISHETAHQWWGNIVAWRSYRDQWLSEGFAQYSAMLYAAKRDGKPESLRIQLRRAHDELLRPPQTLTGLGKGRLADIGPIVLGHRLNTTRSFGAYQALIYSKGALVLRMLNFLLVNPATPDDDAAFRKMMGDFVERHRNGTASTEDFFQVASEHFARSPLAQKYSLSDLNWFYQQWVVHSDFPSYTMEYELKPQPDGKVTLSGTIKQDNVPAGWFMPVPVVFTFDGNQVARTTVGARGPSTAFELTLPKKPIKVELDPDSWVLSEKTTVKGK
jgi:hypothetical protein